MQAEILQAINKILSLLNTDNSIENLFQSLGTALKPVIPFDRFSLSISQMRYWFFLQNDKVTTVRDFSFFDDTSSASIWAFQNQQPICRTDILTDHRFEYDISLDNKGMRSDLIVPFSIDQTPVGTFNFTSFHPYVYSEKHLQAAQAMTSVVALCAKHIQATQEYNIIERVLRALQQAHDIDNILHLILTHLQTQFDRVRIYLYDDQTNTLRGRVQVGCKELSDFQKCEYSFSQDPYSQQTFASDEPQIYQTGTVTHTSWLAEIAEKSILPNNCREWAEIPIRLRRTGKDILIGKISLDNALTQIPINKTQLNRLMVFVSQAAIAIHQEQLFTHMTILVAKQTAELTNANQILQTQNQLITAFEDVSSHSFTYLHTDQIFDNFAEHFIRQGIFRSLMIALVHDHSNTIEVVRSLSRDDFLYLPKEKWHKSNAVGLYYSLDDANVTAETARLGKMQIVEEWSAKFDGRIDTPSSRRNQVAFFIPIKRNAKVLAVLATGSTLAEKEIMLQRIEAMQPLLNQFGIALDHSTLYQELENSERRYHSLFENMQSAFAYHQLVVDSQNNPVDYIFLDVNKAFETMMGLKRDAILGKRVTAVLPGIEKEPIGWIQRYSKVATTGIPDQFEYYSKSLDRWFSISAFSSQKGFFVTLFDEITQRKKTEVQTAALLSFQKQLLDTPLIWVCAFDRNRRFTFWNRGAELISGYSSAEALHDVSFWNRLFPDPTYFKTVTEEARAHLKKWQRIEDWETTICCRDGSRKRISWYANRLTNNNHETTGILALGIDITEQKKLREEVVRLERLKALGELSAGVSHNLNNMLTGILGPAELLKHLTTDPALIENIDDIITSALRASDLVKQFNRTVRRDVHDQLQAVDANKVIQEAIRSATPRWKDEPESRNTHIEIQTHLNPIPHVAATESGLYDVLLNLIFNAVDAMPQGGILSFKTFQHENWIRITIADTGIGMNEKTRLRIFEPFFTTKNNVGTGMGLATVYANIKRWGGNITIESQPAQGSTFYLDFQPGSPILAQEAKPVEPTPSARLLIVEDDAVILKTLDKVLSKNHRVTTAHNSAHALDLIAQGDFDLAFIDLGLPDMSGDKLAQQAKILRPKLRTVLMTGWMLSENDPRRQSCDYYLQKPISDFNLIQHIIAKCLLSQKP